MKCFIYARKSSEAEDRQVLSIEAQIKELKAVALKQGLSIVKVLHESKSAKAPGRPVFNNLINNLYQTEDAGILCWKLDRLARNPIDGGQLIWSLEQGRVKEIVTPHNRYTNSGDDKFMMQLEFGFAKKYIDDLSDNVKRGNRAKLEKGILPGKAPLGYLNDKDKRTIKKDPDRFYLVRRIWDIILSGNYSIPDVLKTADEEWGLTTRQFKNRGGKPLNRSMLYTMLGNPFYYGAILRKGELYPGSHKPMITKDEFDQVQRMLNRPKAKRIPKSFAYTGLIRCGECKSMITAEDKVNRYGYNYIYYHCSKRKGGHKNQCRQRYIRVEDLEKQIMSFLEKIHLPMKHVNWAMKQLEAAKEDEKRLHAMSIQSVKRSIIECDKKLRNLFDLRLKELITDDEFKAQKSFLTNKKIALESNLGDLEKNPDIWFEHSERLFFFLALAKEEFACGQDEIKREILETVGSNFLLQDNNLLIEEKKPFRLMLENAGSPIGWAL